jgi:hypothetical protein
MVQGRYIHPVEEAAMSLLVKFVASEMSCACSLPLSCFSGQGRVPPALRHDRSHAGRSQYVPRTSGLPCVPQIVHDARQFHKDGPRPVQSLPQSDQALRREAGLLLFHSKGSDAAAVPLKNDKFKCWATELRKIHLVAEQSLKSFEPVRSPWISVRC